MKEKGFEVIVVKFIARIQRQLKRMCLHVFISSSQACSHPLNKLYSIAFEL